MMTFDEIKANGKSGEYYAIGNDGRKYNAHFCTEYAGGIMFFAIPSTVEILGYIPRENVEG